MIVNRSPLLPLRVRHLKRPLRTGAFFLADALSYSHSIPSIMRNCAAAFTRGIGDPSTSPRACAGPPSIASCNRSRPQRPSAIPTSSRSFRNSPSVKGVEAAGISGELPRNSRPNEKRPRIACGYPRPCPWEYHRQPSALAFSSSMLSA